MTRAATLTIAVLASALVAGCTTSQAGTPRASVSEPGSGTSSAGTSPTVARPKPLDLHEADTCRLLTDQRLTALSVDRAPSPGQALEGSLLAGSPGCSFLSLGRQYGFLIVASTQMGLAEFIERTGSRPSQRIEVKGYPAISEEGNRSAPERGNGACFVNVDVADGQLLQVQFSQIAASQDKRLPIETLCAKAAEVAEAAVTTLQGG
jgi:hypothetical protein